MISLKTREIIWNSIIIFRITITKEEEKSRLVECNLDSDEEEDKTPPKEDDKGQNIRLSSKSKMFIQNVLRKLFLGG